MTEEKYRPFNEDELLKQIGIQNVFEKGICVKCYAEEFEKEFQSALKIARLK